MMDMYGLFWGTGSRYIYYVSSYRTCTFSTWLKLFTPLYGTTCIARRLDGSTLHVQITKPNGLSPSLHPTNGPHLTPPPSTHRRHRHPFCSFWFLFFFPFCSSMFVHFVWLSWNFSWLPLNYYVFFCRNGWSCWCSFVWREFSPVVYGHCALIFSWTTSNRGHGTRTISWHWQSTVTWSCHFP